MAIKKETYVEPASYFNEAMRKAAREFDNKKAAAEKSESNNSQTKKGGECNGNYNKK